MAIEIYSGKFLRLVLEEDSSGKTREKVYLKDAVTIVPIVGDEKLVFVKEKRWESEGIEKLKLITGYVEENEKPLQAAQRELAEEIGCSASNWKQIFILERKGTVNQNIYYFCAHDPKFIGQKEPNITSTFEINVDDLPNLILKNQLGVMTSGAVARLYEHFTNKSALENSYEV